MPDFCRRGYLRTTAAVALALLTAVPAVADSDGYYCVGPNYLAWQFGMSTPNPPHRLQVMRLGANAKLVPHVLELPPFQVHGIECADAGIRLGSTIAAYSSPLDSERKPRSFEAVSEPWRGKNAERLGGFGFGTPGFAVIRRPLLTDTSGHRYQLVIIPSRTRSDPCDTNVETQLQELNRQGKLLRKTVLFRGRGWNQNCIAPD
ncbi:MAG: hypothetical protein EBY17_13065 [Acidobacteriia bacterium]|nr:hypothetical protein [Terriglobia bacterium]